jgi:hypothetical protein
MANITRTTAPTQIAHDNRLRSVTVSASAASGYSVGTVQWMGRRPRRDMQRLGARPLRVGGVREHQWFVAGVRRYHCTLATLLNGLIDAGLMIARVVEPAPTDDWLRERPEHSDERWRPMFLLVRPGKP